MQYQGSYTSGGFWLDCKDVVMHAENSCQKTSLHLVLGDGLYLACSRITSAMASSAAAISVLPGGYARSLASSATLAYVSASSGRPAARSRLAKAA